MYKIFSLPLVNVAGVDIEKRVERVIQAVVQGDEKARTNCRKKKISCQRSWVMNGSGHGGITDLWRVKKGMRREHARSFGFERNIVV